VEDRLRLCIQVCRAVQHAHQKGVIHRDLKPGNILVSTQDGQPFAKVIDFGIAKATAGRLTDKTLFTEQRQLLGTPEYMSPEQVEGSIDIDTRSDVYSLGVLLYELLTGSPPFDPEQLRTAALAELQRIIREVEPPTPSVRLSRGAVAGSAPAGHARGARPGTWHRQASGQATGQTAGLGARRSPRRSSSPNPRGDRAGPGPGGGRQRTGGAPECPLRVG
jgi:serine/threonine protein kinase